MFDLELRKLQQKVFLPIAQIVGSAFTPNQITVMGFILGIFSSIAIYNRYSGLSVLLFLLNRVFDALDGTVARLTGKQSDFGGYLDIITDFTVYSFIPIAATLADPTDSSLKILPFLISTYFVNAASLFQLSALLEKRNLGAGSKKELTSVNMPPAVRNYLAY